MLHLNVKQNDFITLSAAIILSLFQVFCRKQGASLLQINSADENNWVYKNFRSGMQAIKVEI